MRQFNILYEVDEWEDGGELAERFLSRFLKDVNGLDHTITSIENDVVNGSVTATIETRARITDEWFGNADTAVEA